MLHAKPALTPLLEKPCMGNQGQVLRFDNYKAGNLAWIKDAASNTINYTYDSNGVLATR